VDKRKGKQKQPRAGASRAKKGSPAPLESKQKGTTGESSSVASVDTYKKDLPAYRPKYTTQQIARKKALFLEAMNRGIFSPGIAARAAGISRNTALAWRDKDPEFSAAWDEAVETALDQMEETIREAALNLNQPHKLTGAMFILNGYRRERFMPMMKHEHTGPGGGPILAAVAQKIKLMDTGQLREELRKILGPALVESGDGG